METFSGHILRVYSVTLYVCRIASAYKARVTFTEAPVVERVA